MFAMSQKARDGGVAIVYIYLLLSLAACSNSHQAEQKTSFSAQVPALQTIPLELTTTTGNQQLFSDGEEIQFLLSLGDDAYIYMYHLDASDKAVRILPSQHRSTHFFNRGYFLTVPDYDKGYRFYVHAPFGEQTIWIFASDKSIKLDEDLTIEAVKEKIKKSSVQAFGFASFEMRTSQK